MWLNGSLFEQSPINVPLCCERLGPEQSDVILPDHSAAGKSGEDCKTADQRGQHTDTWAAEKAVPEIIPQTPSTL